MVFDIIEHLQIRPELKMCKQMNYAEFKSEKFEDYKRQIREMVAERQ